MTPEQAVEMLKELRSIGEALGFLILICSIILGILIGELVRRVILAREEARRR